MVSAGAANRRPEPEYAEPLGALEFDDLMRCAGVPSGPALSVVVAIGQALSSHGWISWSVKARPWSVLVSSRIPR